MAASDKLWREIQTSPTPEVPFTVLGIPLQVLEVSSELQYRAPASESVDSSESPVTPFIMFPLRLVKLRDIALSRPFIDEAKLVEAARAHAKEVEEHHALILQSVRKKGKGTSKKRGVEENARETRKVEEAFRQGQDKVLEMQNELRLVTEKQVPKAPATTQRSKGGAAFDRFSNPTKSRSAGPLAYARVVTSKSSKLNYLLKEVRIIFRMLRLNRLSDLGFGTFSDGEILNIF